MDHPSAANAVDLLRASEQRLQRALRVAKVGSWEWDVIADTVVWTDELYRMYEADPATFAGSYAAFLERVHPEDRERVDRIVGASMLSGESFDFLHRISCAAGGERVMHARGEIVRNAEGETVAMVGTVQDITESHRREQALAEVERQLVVAQRLARSGTWRYDIKTKKSEWSAELFRLYGLEPSSEAVELDQLFEHMHPDDAARIRGLMDRAIETGEGWSGDVRIRTVTGETRILSGRAEVECDDAGTPICIRGTRQDVTELREHEARLKASEERAQLASRQKSQFLANMSHEIRTPLNGVVGMTELLADSALTESQREHVNALRGAATSLLGLLNDILDLSKIEAGKVDVDPVDCHLPTLIAETTALFRVAADTKGIELRAEVDPSTPDWVRIDASRAKQVFGNLVANAVKFTERGSVTLAIRRVGTRLVFSVTDTGIGIAAADRDRLMCPFEQGDASTTRRFGGTGLGLAICRELTQLMGGEISFDSTPGEGTTFVVELPYEPGREPQRVPSPPRPAVEVAHVGRRVLLAEDTPVNQLVARAMLEKSGWTVEIVDNGQDALDALPHGAFDVVILDCQMPVLDGFAAARVIREMPAPLRDVPILAMTASALPEDRRRCLEAGMDEYLSKPISRAALDDAMARVLALRASA